MLCEICEICVRQKVDYLRGKHGDDLMKLQCVYPIPGANHRIVAKKYKQVQDPTETCVYRSGNVFDIYKNPTENPTETYAVSCFMPVMR